MDVTTCARCGGALVREKVIFRCLNDNIPDEDAEDKTVEKCVSCGQRYVRRRWIVDFDWWDWEHTFRAELDEIGADEYVGARIDLELDWDQADGDLAWVEPGSGGADSREECIRRVHGEVTIPVGCQAKLTVHPWGVGLHSLSFLSDIPTFVLHTLVLAGEARVTDLELANVGRHESLRVLDLRNTGVTDAGLLHLVNLRHLEVLHLEGTAVTGAAAARLDARLPHCRMELGIRPPSAGVPDPVFAVAAGLEGIGGIEALVAEAARRTRSGEPGLKDLVGLLAEWEDPAKGELPDELIPGYRLVMRLGTNGMARVYAGIEIVDYMPQVIAVMPPGTDADTRRRYARVIDLFEKLRHRNLVGVYEHGSVNGYSYLITEYSPGESLDSLMARSGGHLTIEQAATIILGALDGLAHLHERGIVHRDLRPRNIWLAEWDAGVAKLTGFWLAKRYDTPDDGAKEGPAAGSGPFLPREQLIDFAHVEPASDVWAMGATFYAMLTGKPPRGDVTDGVTLVPGEGPIDVMLREPVTPIRERDPSIPPRLAAVIGRALSEDPAERYQDAAAFRDALEDALRPAPDDIVVSRPSKVKPRRPDDPNSPREPEAGESDDPMAALTRLLLIRQLLLRRLPKIPGYEIGRLVGAHGMARVYEATRRFDCRRVAIEVVPPEAGSGARLLYARVVDLVGDLDHPNLVRVLDHGSVDGGSYLVTEYSPGESVHSLMARSGGHLAIERATKIVLGALEGLAHLHEHGIVHRDLKAGNIWLAEEDGGVARLTAFEFAKRYDAPDDWDREGAVGGTGVFMPREQLIDYQHTKPVSDVWSMGATFYNMITGEFPRDFPMGKAPADVLLNDPVIPIEQRDRSLPGGLAAVIDRALSEDVAGRYQTAAEFREALAGAVRPLCDTTIVGRPPDEEPSAPEVTEQTDAEGADPMAVLIKQLLERRGAAGARSPEAKIPGYEIDRELSLGGYGALYRARRVADGSVVALFIGSRMSSLPRFRERFAHGVDLWRRLDHPNCVRILNHGVDAEPFFVAMEYRAGGSVADLIDRQGGRIAPADAVPLMLAALAGLRHVHEHGLVYAEAEPGKLLLDRDGELRLAPFDFFLAGRTTESTLDDAQTFMGAPCRYLPREQVVNYRHRKPVSDVWAMGATFYNMLTGEYPRDFPMGRSPADVILNGPVIPIERRAPSLPRGLAAVIDRALSDDLAERYPTAAEFREALEGAVRAPSEVR